MSSPRLLTPQRQRACAGLHAERWCEPQAWLDPFLMVEHFRMKASTLGPHPHAGLSTVTYLFDDSPQGFVCRHSLGQTRQLPPGGLHWLCAGRGAMHDEFPSPGPGGAEGLLMLVNLPAAQKLQAPAAGWLAPEAMPRDAGPGWRRVQVFGGSADMPLAGSTGLAVVDLDAEAHFTVQLPPDRQGVVIALRGSGTADGRAWRAGQALAVAPGQTLEVGARQPLRLACLSGVPLHEPVVRHGPFAMSSEGQVVEALQRFQSGAMGRLQPRNSSPE